MGLQSRGWLTRNVRILSAVSFLQDLASELLYPLLPIYLTAVLGAPPPSSAPSKAAEGGAAMTKLAAGPLGDRFARRPLIAVGCRMAALGKLIVAVAGAWPGVLAGRVVDRLGRNPAERPVMRYWSTGWILGTREGFLGSTAPWTRSERSWVR